MTTVFIGWKPSRVGAAPSTQPRQQHGAPKLAIRIWFGPRRHNYSMTASGRLDALRASATRPGHFRPTPAPLSRLPWNLALPAFARCDSTLHEVENAGRQTEPGHACGVAGKPCEPAGCCRWYRQARCCRMPPYGRGGRLQVRVADGCYRFEEGRLNRSTIVSRQLPCFLEIVDLVVDEGIGQRGP